MATLGSPLVRGAVMGSLRQFEASHFEVTKLAGLSAEGQRRGGSEAAGRRAHTVCVPTAVLRLSQPVGNRMVRLRAMSGEQTTVRSVPVQVISELLEAGHTYLDVRTAEEFSAGHVEGAVNIPFMLKQNGGMTRNPKFLDQVDEHFNKEHELVVGCQSGKRSLMAINELQGAGYISCTDVGGGFSAWKESGLPVHKA